MQQFFKSVVYSIESSKILLHVTLKSWRCITQSKRCQRTYYQQVFIRLHIYYTPHKTEFQGGILSSACPKIRDFAIPKFHPSVNI